MSLTANVNEKANLIWAIADKLTGVYKPHEYGEVILPMTVIRRFDCILADTKQAVLDRYETVKTLPMKDVLLTRASGHSFYNTSKYTFEKLLDEPDNIEANFRAYLNGFSANVRDILEKFKFDGHIGTMASKGILYIVIKEFTTPKANLHPSHISNLEMGYIFEEIIRRFSEAHNEDAGQHYTPREVIELMVNILFHDDNTLLSGSNVGKMVYDPACGTGGMLSVAEEYLKKLNASAKLIPFGQEINDQTFAICKADMLIKGNDADFIKDGNTLSDDRFQGQTFDYILSNPPFGREWKNEKDKVEAEARLGFAGRFGAGLPAIGDGQMLFLLTAISKMKDRKDGGSRVAIIHNGSPLFTGDAGSGPSEIRKYILENDLLEAIVALPNDIFYNTGIATYIWVLSNKKAGTKREGRVQLINANGLFEKRRKSLGNKRNDIPASAIEEITRIYGDMVENEISKVFENADFGYTKITVERPLRDEKGKPVLKKGKPQPDTSLRDTENVPLMEDIRAYFEREVLPFAPDAWIDEGKSKVGYAVRYLLECRRQIEQKGYKDMDVLVAFSGEVEDEGNTYTEVKMNKTKSGETVQEKQLPEVFHTDDFGMLIVAEKYQTGFDEPLLHTMFVDKKLSGVKAVQTLSRLNRTIRGKQDTFVLDFVNSAEEIKASFEPYYEETVLEKETDPNVIYDLKNTLDEYRVYQQLEIDKFAQIFFARKDQAVGDLGALQGALRPAMDRYLALEDEKKELFKSTLARFNRIYAFITQVCRMFDKDIHKFSVYAKFLAMMLPKGDAANEKVDDKVMLEYYRLEKDFEGGIGLEGTEEGFTPITGEAGRKEKKKDPLTVIIEKINEKFGTNFTEMDKVLLQIENDYATSDKWQGYASNNDRKTFMLLFEKDFPEMAAARYEQNEDFFVRMFKEPEMMGQIIQAVGGVLYERLKKRKRAQG